MARGSCCNKKRGNKRKPKPNTRLKVTFKKRGNTRKRS